MPHLIAFFDIEASGLDGWPIEIGWAIPHADTGHITTRSLLIKPSSAWSINDHWDAAAEALHGITRADLRANGQSPDQVLSAMNADLDDFTLHADAPAWDLPWLEAVAAAAATPQRFTASTNTP